MAIRPAFDNSGKAINVALQVSTAPVVFGYNGAAVTSKYLELFPSNPSNDTPFVSPRESLIVGLAGSARTSTTAQVDIFIDAVKVADLNWVASEIATPENLLSITLAIGEELSLQVTSGTLQDPAVFVDVQGAL